MNGLGGEGEDVVDPENGFFGGPGPGNVWRNSLKYGVSLGGKFFLLSFFEKRKWGVLQAFRPSIVMYSPLGV